MTVPSTEPGAIATQAAEWHARLDTPDMDWDAFALWLDVDAAHRDAYDAIALLDADVAEHRDAILSALPANDAVEDHGLVKPRRARWWVGGGIAAAAVAALIAPQIPFFAAETLVGYQTGPTETRTIDLKDGSHILLDRNSRLALADGASPQVEMQGGAAYFDVRHDPSRAFVISAGDYEVRDIGTKFDLVMTQQKLGVAVSEGKLTVALKGGDGTAIGAGERIDVATATGEATVRPVVAASVGSWRKGQLIYRDTPLALVAMDLARYVGHPVTVDPAISDLRVSGVLSIGDGARLVQQIEALLPVKVVISQGAVRLVRSSTR